MGIACKEIENVLVINKLGEMNWCGWGEKSRDQAEGCWNSQLSGMHT